MTIRRDMLKTVGQAEKLLGDSTGAVVDFLLSQHTRDGGFRGRDEQSDLYYTVFGIESLMGLSGVVNRDRVTCFLNGFGDGSDLDMVHLTSLIRCWADICESGEVVLPRSLADGMISHLEGFRCANGGYANERRIASGTVYGCFLALGAYQDMNGTMPDRGAVLACLESLRSTDGGYGNEPGNEMGTTPATAAAGVIGHYLGEPVDEQATEWLRARCDQRGGFFVSPGFQEAGGVPDLLSTATALHALALAGRSIDKIREVSLDYLDCLWSRQGGFFGHPADATVDCEYTYYGLLALGHLSDSL